MADNLSVGFSNKTPEVWTIGIYQTLPSSAGLDSVSWKQGSAPRNGKTNIGWTVKYNVALADFFQQGSIGVYSSSQVLDTDRGKKWKVVFNGVVQELLEDGAASEPDQIIIRNVSTKKANMGIGMDGAGSVFKGNVLSGADAQFIVRPTYWAALFNNVVLGEVISSNVTIEPLILKFEGGIKRIELEAKIVGETLIFGVPGGQSLSTPMSLVRSRMAEHEALNADRTELAARVGPTE